MKSVSINTEELEKLSLTDLVSLEEFLDKMISKGVYVDTETREYLSNAPAECRRQLLDWCTDVFSVN